MKTVKAFGTEVTFDENAPCKCCGEPVLELSMSGPEICPSCDVGRCRWCGVPLLAVRPEMDGGRSLAEIRRHMAWHKTQREKSIRELDEAFRRTGTEAFK